ncbi:hypothetical protein OR16_37275 [Cupriavidus basilensis OR16]|uniref:Uncharacterized protein n=1 Tax=Cupriavidus basilensis OR16 TaxID=1127483 RepID=H1SGD8_9BURK|nr:hypothetical protein [Cupriavidus basilensis]EHP38476.1 hypothetical protein OR16_37275 [Cupriavidus basilensis OR16]
MHKPAVTYRVTPRAKALDDGSYQPKVLVAIYRGDALLRDVALYARGDPCPLRATAARLAEALAFRIQTVLKDVKDVRETDDVATVAVQALLRRIGLRTSLRSVAPVSTRRVRQ